MPRQVNLLMNSFVGDDDFIEIDLGNFDIHIVDTIVHTTELRDTILKGFISGSFRFTTFIHFFLNPLIILGIIFTKVRTFFTLFILTTTRGTLRTIYRVTRLTVRCFCLWLLMLISRRSLRLTVFVNVSCQFTNILKGLNVNHPLNQNTLLIGVKGNVNELTNLEIQIDTISQVHLPQVLVFNTKEVIIRQFFVSLVETLGKTRIPMFHLLLNTSILNDVDKRMRNIFRGIHIRSVECVSDFMTNQHIIDRIGCTFPLRECQNTGINVKLSRLHVSVLNHNVLSGEKFSQL